MSINNQIKILTICNSSNAFFKNYFNSLLEFLDSSNVFFAGNSIFSDADDPYNFQISSYTENAFIDVRMILDFIRSFWIIPIARFKGIKYIHFISAHASNVFQGIIAKFLGMKLAFTIHDLIPHPDRKTRMVNLYNRFIIKYLADRIVIHNQDYANQLSHKEVDYIKLGGYSYKPVSRDFNPCLLFFGRIEPYKGIANLYRLAQIMIDKGMNWKVIIAGKGQLPEDLIVPPNVEIINRFISDEELIELHSISCFTILPYDSASQSAVIIHSYALGTPVIVYDIGGLAEYVKIHSTGLVVKHNDFDTIVSYLQNMDKIKFQQIQKEVEKYFLSNFSDKSFATETLKMYQSWS